MLLFVCDRCKFSSPGYASLCQTCGAKLTKDEPVREVVYRVASAHPAGFFSNARETGAQIWELGLNIIKSKSKTISEKNKPRPAVDVSLPSKGFARP